MQVHPQIENAAKVLEGATLTRDELVAVAREVKGGDLLDLLSLADKVRRKFAPGFHACSILNAKSGKCGENCRFCAQSAFYAAPIETYPLLPPEKVLAEMKKKDNLQQAAVGICGATSTPQWLMERVAEKIGE